MRREFSVDNRPSTPQSSCHHYYAALAARFFQNPVAFYQSVHKERENTKYENRDKNIFHLSVFFCKFVIETKADQYAYDCSNYFKGNRHKSKHHPHEAEARAEGTGKFDHEGAAVPHCRTGR